jgi:hypothetical protein
LRASEAAVIDALIASAVILAILLGGLAVDAFYRRFARRHPDLGPFRPEGGCGGGCRCSGGRCGSGD